MDYTHSGGAAAGAQRPSDPEFYNDVDDETIDEALNLLSTRDHIIGLEATVSRLQREVDDLAKRHVAEMADREIQVRSEVSADYESSTTWRLGRMALLPVLILRRIRR